METNESKKFTGFLDKNGKKCYVGNYIKYTSTACERLARISEGENGSYYYSNKAKIPTLFWKYIAERSEVIEDVLAFLLDNTQFLNDGLIVWAEK